MVQRGGGVDRSFAIRVEGVMADNIARTVGCARARRRSDAERAPGLQDYRYGSVRVEYCVEDGVEDGEALPKAAEAVPKSNFAWPSWSQALDHFPRRSARSVAFRVQGHRATIPPRPLEVLRESECARVRPTCRNPLRFWTWEAARDPVLANFPPISRRHSTPHSSLLGKFDPVAPGELRLASLWAPVWPPTTPTTLTTPTFP